MLKRTKCNICKKLKWKVKFQTLNLPSPVGRITSRIKMCNKCGKKAQKMTTNPKPSKLLIIKYKIKQWMKQKFM